MTGAATVTPVLDPTTIDAVIFDIGGVFLIPHPDPIRAMLSTVGIEVPHDEAAFHLAHHRGVRAITDMLGGQAAPATDTSATIWSAYDAAYFAALGVPGHELVAASNARDVQRREGVAAVWKFRLQHNIDAFHRLATGPRPLAIVSNNDGSAPSEMVEHGVCQVGPGPLPSVVAVVDSAILGIAKPDPRIFGPVADALPGIPASRMLYVGDTVHADVRGANQAGLQVVQLDPHELHDDHDHHRLPDVGALVDLLCDRDRPGESCQSRVD